MNFDQPFSHALVPVKTLWFEFLLDPNLLQKHLQDRYADPSAVELIILFLNNAVSLSGLGASLEDLISANSSGTPLLSPSGNNSTALSLTDSSTPQQSQSSQSTEARPDTNLNGNISAAACQTILNNKKCLGLRLLAVKVAAHLDFNLTIIEKHLPINMQFMLLNELIKICEHNNGYKCSLFAYMNYYRWILRSVAKLTYPARKTQNVPIPLLQQIGKFTRSSMK